MNTCIYVGLGNPNKMYVKTRHNIGWMVLDAFAMKHGVKWAAPNELYMIGLHTIGRSRIVLVKPLTYMNASGVAVKHVLENNGALPNQCVIVVDEYNFPVGRTQLRDRGSDGGHNGLASMIAELSTDRFWRLRCGIGRNFEPGGMADYVLSAFSVNEIHARDEMIHDAVLALESIAAVGPEAAKKSVNDAGKLKGGDVV